jgi:hypothetical protein
MCAQQLCIGTLAHALNRCITSKQAHTVRAVEKATDATEEQR